jgi:phosphoribosylamine--glycine ligase
MLIAAREGQLKSLDARWKKDAALTVVMASKGYPGAYEKGQVITGLEEASKLPGVTIFHAGTEAKDGNVIAMGGRVLNVTATGRDVAEARSRAYDAVSRIHWDGAFFRRDIGWRALDRAQHPKGA